MPTLTEIRGTYPFVSTIPPDAEFTTIGQRLDGTFLVDVKFNLWKDAGFHRYSVLKYGAQKYGPDDFTFNAVLAASHYSIDGGINWLVPTPQTYDRKHSSVNPMVINATKREFDFVWNAFSDLPVEFDGEVIFRFELSASPTIVITSSPVPVTTVVTPQTVTRSRLTNYDFKIDDFLGVGPIAPWRRGPQDFMMARGRELVVSAVKQILATKAATDSWGGELAWNPGFGSLFWTIKHNQGDDIAAEIAAGFAELALGIEPRVIVVDSKVDYEDREGGGRAMNIRITYSLIQKNVAANKVYQSDVEQVTVEV